MESPSKELIAKVISGNATKQEAKIVAEWFSTSAEGHAYLSEMLTCDAQQLDEEGVDQNAVPLITSQKILSEINEQIRQKAFRRMIFSVAAVLMPFVLLAGLTFYTNSRVDLFGVSEYSEIYIPKGDKTRILFQDGSQAFVNSDTKIKYPRKFGLVNRKIEIEGEAYFKISTNSKRPFVVEINKTKVKVLGTSFNVKAHKDDEDINIVLDKGKIVYETPQNDYNILPGHQAIYNKKTGKCTILPMEKSSEASLWVNNLIAFKDTPLSEVLKTLNRAFNADFKVENPLAYKYTYTLTTGKTTLQEVTKELEKITPLRFRVNHDNVISVNLK